MKRNEIVNVFSFESGSDNDIRDVFDENEIEIISIDNDGNLIKEMFVEYGEMISPKFNLGFFFIIFIIYFNYLLVLGLLFQNKNDILNQER